MHPPPRPSAPTAPRRRLVARLPAALLALALAAPAASALQDAEDELRRMIEEMARRIEELTRETAELRARLDQAAPAGPDDEYYIPRLARDFDASGQSPTFGNTYTKPFLSNLGERTYVGGYMDLEFSDSSGSSSKEFDQHRFVPFFYSDVSDRVKMSAEIEYEHGHELEVEFAQIDYLIDDLFNLRAGIQLLPVGKLNEVHDSPVQDLSFRPLVDTYIIPTTLRDAGLGAFGDFNDSMSYQVAVTNGFRGLDATGKNVITPTKGLRDAAPHKDKIGDPFSNINDKLAWSGRFAWDPALGMQFGVSALFDTYDEKGDNALNIYALDATLDGKAVDWLPDQLELLGEAAWADLERDAFAKAANDGKTPVVPGSSPVAGDMNGWYAQANWHFEPDFLEGWRRDGLVDRDAHFTFVTRYDDVKLDTYSMQRTTFGLNFRPNAHDTVYKLDLQLNDDSGSAAGSNDDNAVVFSVATYF